jgi:hypothetical protein
MFNCENLCWRSARASLRLRAQFFDPDDVNQGEVFEMIRNQSVAAGSNDNTGPQNDGLIRMLNVISAAIGRVDPDRLKRAVP